MKWLDLIRFAVFLGVVTLLVKPVGGYLARVFGRERTWLDPILLPVERVVHRIAGSDPDDEMEWGRYAAAFVISPRPARFSFTACCACSGCYRGPAR